jgi:protein TonB
MPEDAVKAETAQPVESVAASSYPDSEESGVGRGTSAEQIAVEAAGHSEFDEYRWALTRAMKGERRYPPMARMRGITGKVTVRLVWSPAFALPQVELVASSGSSLLDEDALAKFARAVRVTPLPEALRVKSFQLSQTVDYSLESLE